jgi:hypothetical protein
MNILKLAGSYRKTSYKNNSTFLLLVSKHHTPIKYFRMRARGKRKENEITLGAWLMVTGSESIFSQGEHVRLHEMFMVYVFLMRMPSLRTGADINITASFSVCVSSFSPPPPRPRRSLSYPVAAIRRAKILTFGTVLHKSHIYTGCANYASYEKVVQTTIP